MWSRIPNSFRRNAVLQWEVDEREIDDGNSYWVTSSLGLLVLIDWKPIVSELFQRTVSRTSEFLFLFAEK